MNFILSVIKCTYLTIELWRGYHNFDNISSSATWTKNVQSKRQIRNGFSISYFSRLIAYTIQDLKTPLLGSQNLQFWDKKWWWWWDWEISYLKMRKLASVLILKGYKKQDVDPNLKNNNYKMHKFRTTLVMFNFMQSFVRWYVLLSSMKGIANWMCINF